MLSLVACGKSGTTATETLKPGEWEITTKVLSAEIISTPAGVPKEMLSKAFDPAVLNKAAPKDKVCYDGKDSESILSIKEKDGCKGGAVSIKDGNISADLTCTSANKEQLALKINGTYKADSYQANAELQTKDPSGLAIALKTELVGKRIGECSAKQG